MALNVVPVKVSTKVPAIYRNKERVAAFRRHMRNAHKKAVKDAESLLKTAIKTSGAVATRRLLNSVTAKMVSGKNATAMFFETEVGFKAPGSAYAYFANYGRDPGGPPPYIEISTWARARGIPQEAVEKIRSHIAHYGTEGHGFMELVQPMIERNNARVASEAVVQFKSAIRAGDI